MYINDTITSASKEVMLTLPELKFSARNGGYRTKMSWLLDKAESANITEL
jgi:hypothetical protein